MIALPPLGELEDRLWLALMDIAERRAGDWTLVGGQMVLLHALEHGATPPRISTDLDLVVDARVRPPAIPAMAGVLDDLGFRLGGVAPPTGWVTASCADRSRSTSSPARAPGPAPT